MRMDMCICAYTHSSEPTLLVFLLHDLAMLAATQATCHRHVRVQTQSPAAAAAEATIRTARHRVPELIALFERGAAKGLRLIFQRPFSAWRSQAAPMRCNSSSDSTSLSDGDDDDSAMDSILDDFHQVFAPATRAAHTTKSQRSGSSSSRPVHTRDGLSERDAVVYRGECGEWVWV